MSGGFETALTVGLAAQDGTASEIAFSHIQSYYSLLIHTVVGEDVAIPQPLEVVFEVGQMESTSCANISVISDTELEGEEFFTFTIVSAGAEPHARIRNPSVATVTIEDSTSVAGSDDQSGVLSLQWAIVIPTLCSIAIGTSCLLAAIFYRCHSKHKKHSKTLVRVHSMMI